jgi:thiamine biosynthesis lipoprotein
MSKKLILPTLIIVIVLVGVWMYDRQGKVDDKPEMEYQIIHGNTQGTTYNMTYEYNKGEDLKPEIDSILHDFDMSLSTYDPVSIISRINQNDSTVEIDTQFKEVFLEAKRVNEATGGVFDITVAPLVNAWGFGFAPGADVDSAMIDSLLQFVGMDKVRLSGNKILKDLPQLMLDVNAIAQGYSVDVVSTYLEEMGIENYLVEIGGELKCKGLNPKGEDWKIGIDRPQDGNLVPGKNMQAVVAIKGKSLATSGNYRKFYEKDGIKYAHSIDPRTGYPVLSKLLSATLITDNCITADAYATAFMVMGLEKSIEFIKSGNEPLDAYLIYSDDEGNFRVYSTPGMKKHILDELKE